MSNLLLSRDGNETLTDPNQLTQRWKEHFGALLNVESSTDDTALDHIDPLPEQQHLNEEPTLQEVIKAIEKTKSNKSPGMDGIPAEVYKYGGTQLTGKVHELILMCWRQGIVPQEFKDVLIVPIYKNKGDHRDCNNYRGISLLAIAGKIMAKVIQSRLAQLAEEVLTESQCGFRRERSTIDMIFSLRQIQEKAIEQYQELYIVFVDFRKAFDSVDRDMLWRVLRRFGCPEHFVRMIEQFHTGAKGRVVVRQQESDQLDVNHGTKQGCVLAPTLFTLFLTTVLVSLHQELGNGIFVRTRADGKLFNLARLKARTKTREELISELLFADDTALVAHDVATMQNMVDIFSQASEKIGLQINKGKTEVLYQPSPDNTEPQPPIITINGEALKVVKSFKYLGSTVSDDARADQEISNRIQSACASYGKLEKRLWSRGGIRLDTKCRVYKALVLPALLYSAETYTLYRRHIKRLEAVQQRHLRRIMKIKWDDFVSDVEVLRRAGLESVEAGLAATQLRWTGHVVRMNEERIPKIALYGELARGSRKVGGQKLRYRDVVKRHLKAMDIEVGTWEELAADRTGWRASIHRGKARIEERRAAASELRHYRRHNPGNYPCATCGKTFHTARGLLQHRRMMHRSSS